VKSALNEFGIDLSADIVASTHDGASMMLKYGRLITCHSQLCLIHAIHLAVTKVFYKKLPSQFVHESEEEEDENLEWSEGELSDVENEISPDLFLNETINEKLQQARKLVKFFNRSPVKNATLQKFVIESHKTELKLILDIKTRWNSILAMAKRLVRLESCIEKSLTELNDSHLFDSSLFRFLQQLIDCLQPVEEAILYIGRKNVTLLEAEGALKFVFSSLQKSKHQISLDLSDALEDEISKRRSKDVVSLMKFLQTKAWDFLKFNTNGLFPYSSKSQIYRTALEFYHQLTGEVQLEDDILSSGEFEEPIQQTEPGSLKHFIDEEMSFKSEATSNFDMKSEFTLSSTNKCLTSKLEFLNDALSTIQPSSISSERAFSVASSFMPKDRNRMGHELHGALIFLREYFHKKEKEATDNSKMIRIE